jgi:hypothetical protein
MPFCQDHGQTLRILGGDVTLSLAWQLHTLGWRFSITLLDLSSKCLQIAKNRAEFQKLDQHNSFV